MSKYKNILLSKLTEAQLATYFFSQWDLDRNGDPRGHHLFTTKVHKLFLAKFDSVKPSKKKKGE